jgi:hypothetical protein
VRVGPRRGPGQRERHSARFAAVHCSGEVEGRPVETEVGEVVGEQGRLDRRTELPWNLSLALQVPEEVDRAKGRDAHAGGDRPQTVVVAPERAAFGGRHVQRRQPFELTVRVGELLEAGPWTACCLVQD